MGFRRHALASAREHAHNALLTRAILANMSAHDAATGHKIKDGTFTFQCLLTSKFADFRSLCRMGGWHICRYSIPLAASKAMLMRLTQSSCAASACNAHKDLIEWQV